MRVLRSRQTLVIIRSHSDREMRAPGPRTIPPANSLFLKFSRLLVCDYFHGSNGLVWLFLLVLFFFYEFRLNFFLLFSLFFLECYQFFFTFGWTLGSAKHEKYRSVLGLHPKKRDTGDIPVEVFPDSK